MALDPTARESNIRDSIVKYFVDNLEATHKIPLVFDKNVATPQLTGTPSPIDRWVSVDFGDLDAVYVMGTLPLEIYCCQRKDPEGFKLAQLRDTVMQYLKDSDGTYSDGMMRIPFYQTLNGVWTQLSSFLVWDIKESRSLDADDETKFKVITVVLRFGVK